MNTTTLTSLPTTTADTGNQCVAKWIQRFIWSAGGILASTGTGKLFAAYSTTQSLDLADPLFGIPYRYLLLAVAILEWVVAVLCFLGRRTDVSLTLIACLASIFSMYRVGVWLIDYHPCQCFGSLTDTFGLSSVQADRISVVLLTYMLLGSYGIGIWRRCWFRFSNNGVQPKSPPKRAAHPVLLLACLPPFLPQTCFSSQPYGVEGFCQWENCEESGRSLGTNLATFRLNINECQWEMFIKVVGSPEDYRHVVCDGTTTYYILVHRTAVEAMKAGGQEVGPNIAGATALRRPVPNFFTYDPAGPIWLAYASACYFDRITPSPIGSNNKLLEIDVASGLGTASGADVEYFRVNRPAKWILLKDSGLPREVTYFETGFVQSLVSADMKFSRRRMRSPYSSGFTNSHYTVLRSTNYYGLVLPVEASYKTYWAKSDGRSSNDLWVRIAYYITATNYIKWTGSVITPPLLPGPTLITEARFVEDVVNPKSSYSYLAKKRFPTEEEVRASAGYASAPPQRQPTAVTPQNWLSLIGVALIIGALIPSVLLFWWRRSPPFCEPNKQQTKERKHQT